MKLEIIDYKEDSNGGATVTLDLDNETREFLIERGFNDVLRDAIMKAQLHKGFSQEDLSVEISNKNESIVKNLRNYEEWRKDER